MKKLIKKLIEKMGYVLIPLSEYKHPQRLVPLKIKHFLDLYFAGVNPETFFFVQFGAHDGRHHDPLHQYITQYSLKGLALEPQKGVFKQLQNTYKNFPNVTCVNMAIGRKTEKQIFYTVKGETSLATQNKNLLDAYKDRVEEIGVQTITLDDLVKRFRITKIDFLQIDCEGYDFEIIKMIDFSIFSPQIINFESVLMSDVDRAECENLLASLGYKFFRYERDTCAYKI